MKKPSKNLLWPKWIEIEDFEFLCFNLAKKVLEFDEPFPDYSKTDKALLESSLSAPKHAFSLLGVPIEELASILFYSMIKNHPFNNGNKRVAVMTLLVFLGINNKWLDISQDLLYGMAVVTASSKPRAREKILHDNEEIIRNFMVDFN